MSLLPTYLLQMKASFIGYARLLLFFWSFLVLILFLAIPHVLVSLVSGTDHTILLVSVQVHLFFPSSARGSSLSPLPFYAPLFSRGIATKQAVVE